MIFDPSDLAELDKLVARAERAASGDSNDREIDALTDALSEAEAVINHAKRVEAECLALVVHLDALRAQFEEQHPMGDDEEPMEGWSSWEVASDDYRASEAAVAFALADLIRPTA